jgi:hypothetical protein
MTAVIVGLWPRWDAVSIPFDSPPRPRRSSLRTGPEVFRIPAYYLNPANLIAFKLSILNRVRALKSACGLKSRPGPWGPLIPQM